MPTPLNHLIERLVQFGPDGLQSAELLSIVTGNERSQKDYVSICEAALAEYGNSCLVEAESVELVSALTKLPQAMSAKMVAAFALQDRFARPSKSKRPKRVYTAHDVHQLLQGVMQDLPTERLYGLYLDNQCRVKRQVLLSSSGLPDRVMAHPRQILQPAFDEHASAMILVHNHPSGDPRPSRQDRELTEAVEALAEPLAINLLDHVIIGCSKYFSFQEERAAVRAAKIAEQL